LESSVKKKCRDFDGNFFQWDTSRNEESGGTVQSHLSLGDQMWSTELSELCWRHLTSGD